SLTVAGLATELGTAVLTATSTLTVAAARVQFATASLSAASTLTVGATLVPTSIPAGDALPGIARPGWTRPGAGFTDYVVPAVTINPAPALPAEARPG